MSKELLLNPNTPDTLDVIYKGKRRTLIYHRCNGTVTIKYQGCKTQSLIFKDWKNITKVFESKVLSDDEKKLIRERKEQKLTLKYFEAAHYAEFENAYVSKCLKANMKKSPKENELSTGCKIEGELISIGLRLI